MMANAYVACLVTAQYYLFCESFLQFFIAFLGVAQIYLKVIDELLQTVHLLLQLLLTCLNDDNITPQFNTLLSSIIN